LRESLVLSWGVAYIACSFLKPDIFGTSEITGIAIMLPWGVIIIGGLLLSKQGNGRIRNIGSILLIVMGLSEVFAAVASWANVISWHVGFGNRTLLQVSMATYDFVAAIVLLNLGTERLTPASP